MIESDIKAIMGWVLDQGLAGASEPELLHGMCNRCVAAGLNLSRGVVVIDTLHPIHEGRAFRWRNDGVEENVIVEYGRTAQEGEAAENWRRSVFYHLLDSNSAELRRRLSPGASPDFPGLETMATEGVSDFVAFLNRF